MLRPFMLVSLTLSLMGSGAARAEGLPNQWAGEQVAPLGSLPVQIAKKKKKKPADVLVTEAEVIADNIGGTLYYTLRGRIRNRGKDIATQPVVYYEIYDGQDKIVDAGSMLIQPSFLPANGGEAVFQKEIRKGGRVKITLVSWQKQDKSAAEHLQLEFFPRTADAS